jgi:2-C-methyl-D-erythritol 4-phosphate cytidylyltransferase
VLAFEDLNEITSYLVVYSDNEQRYHLQHRIDQITNKTVHWVEGGEQRQDSVFNALEATPADSDFVMIHDCARPLIGREALRDVYEVMVKDQSAVLAHRVVDTIKQVDNESGKLRQAFLKNLDRRHLWAMETPQAFSRKLILETYRRLKEKGLQVNDDTAAIIDCGYSVSIVENHTANPKITHPEDLAVAELLLQQRDQTA